MLLLASGYSPADNYTFFSNIPSKRETWLICTYSLVKTLLNILQAVEAVGVGCQAIQLQTDSTRRLPVRQAALAPELVSGGIDEPQVSVLRTILGDELLYR
jgi:hypothetical protein